MKCISIRQPWAWLIFNGKPVENRTWPSKYRGQVLIHASKTFDVLGASWLDREGIYFPVQSSLVFGAIIGQVNMVDCVTAHPSPFFFGPYGHVYEDPHLFKNPVPLSASQKIFNVAEEKLIKDGLCPACGELLVYPRGDSPYCEDCLWPDEILPEGDGG